MYWTKLFLLFIFIFIILCGTVYPTTLERCKQYSQIVRVQHWKYFGLTFPYHYGIGQLEVESTCRKDAVAFDGGMGLPQFMPGTLKEVEKNIGKINIFVPGDAIKAQAWYMSTLHKQNFGASKQLWITYMCYNSGIGTLRKEYLRAGKDDYNEMYRVCKRKVIKLKRGQLLDFCQVGYTYPLKIYKAGDKYKVFPDLMRFW